MKSIQIQRLKQSDASQLAKLANNVKIWNSLRDYIPYPYTEAHATEFIEHTKEEKPHQTFGIFSDLEFCGIIGIFIQKDVHRLNGEIGFWVGEPYWGRGIATRAIQLILKYGFENLKLERIFASVFENNIASMKVLEKNGFQQEGIFRNAIIKNGKIIDEHRYAILKTGFLK